MLSQHILLIVWVVVVHEFFERLFVGIGFVEEILFQGICDLLDFFSIKFQNPFLNIFPFLYLLLHHHIQKISITRRIISLPLTQRSLTPIRHLQPLLLLDLHLTFATTVLIP